MQPDIVETAVRLRCQDVNALHHRHRASILVITIQSFNDPLRWHFFATGQDQASGKGELRRAPPVPRGRLEAEHDRLPG